MQPELKAGESQLAGLWRGVWKWLALLPVVLLLIFACSQTAHLGMGYPVPSQISSNLYATYAPWERVVMAPVSTAIIEQVPGWQDNPSEEWTQPGVIWAEPTITPPVIGVPNPSPTQEAEATGTMVAMLPTALLTSTPSRTPTTVYYYPIPTSSSTATSTVTATFAWLQTPTPTSTPTPTRTATLIYSPTPTRSATPSYTPTPTFVDEPTPTHTPTPSKTPTPTRTNTPTPTSSDPPTITPTATISPTPTYTPSITLTPTPTYTPTITPTPTPTQPPCGGNIPPGEPDIGLPDGSFASLPCGGLMILDLPALGFSPIDLSTPDTAYDLVFYERKLPQQNTDVIELDWVSIEVGTGPSGSCDTSLWYMAFNWGDYVVTNNGHLGNTFLEIDNQEIPLSFLYGVYPLQTGIAIDLDSSYLDIPPGAYPCIRFISPFNYPDNDPSEVDALEILQ